MDRQPDTDASGSHSLEPDRLFATLYDELHRLAEHHVRRSGALTMSPTTLMHEAYLRIGQREDLAFPDQGRFFAYASRAMRALVIDYARRKKANRRGPEFEITLGAIDDMMRNAPGAEELENLSAALDELAVASPELAQLVDLHFFCGFSLVEIAQLRGVSERTVQRDWRKARLVLHRLLGDEAPSEA
jgi:RNA polymerase sigma factor (TIGR02999 family)